MHVHTTGNADYAAAGLAQVSDKATVHLIYFSSSCLDAGTAAHLKVTSQVLTSRPTHIYKLAEVCCTCR